MLRKVRGQCFDAAHRKKRAKAAKQRLWLSAEQYAELCALWGEKCGICGAGPKGTNRMPVDHCHKTNIIRGILCHRCNTAIGLLRDDPRLMRKAIDYLTQPRL